VHGVSDISEVGVFAVFRILACRRLLVCSQNFGENSTVPVSKCQVINVFLKCLTLEGGTYVLSRKRR